MATFKAVVLKHQQRADKKYPISIRVTNNRKTGYISTGLYAEPSQINRKSFELKDSNLILKTNSLISKYQQKLLELDANILSTITPNDIKDYVSTIKDNLDYMVIFDEYASTLNNKGTIYCVRSILHSMGVYSLPIHQFTSAFIESFKNELNKKKLKDSTKNKYLTDLCAVFKYAQRLYNTEFTQVISHNPFYKLEFYKRKQTARRNITPEQIKYILNYDNPKKNYMICLDAIRLSFCLCGINLKDLLNMNESCLKGDRIEYNRGKTKDKTINMSFTSVKIQPEIVDVIKRRRGKNGKLFDFYQYYKREIYFVRNVNYTLKEIAKELGLSNLTSYYFRHSWATIARNKCGVSNDDIDLALVHSNKNPMADVYIDIDYGIIDRANRKVLDYVFNEKGED